MAQLLFQPGDAQAQAVAFARHLLDLARIGEFAGLAGLRLLFQLLLLFDDLFPAAELVVQFVEGALLV